MDTTTFNQLIRSRRSVFPSQYNGKTISKEIIEQLLENANWAPTHKMTEPWRFKVFTGKGLDHLMDFIKKNYRETTPADKFKEDKVLKFETFKTSVSHAIAICLKRHASSLPEMEEIASVAMAVQNIHLTAAAYGVGGYWSTGGGVLSEPMKEFLQLQEDEKCLGFFYLGHYDEIAQEGKRKPIAEKTEWFG